MEKCYDSGNSDQGEPGVNAYIIFICTDFSLKLD